jgi:hypothetical protein
VLLIVLGVACLLVPAVRGGRRRALRW